MLVHCTYEGCTREFESLKSMSNHRMYHDSTFRARKSASMKGKTRVGHPQTEETRKKISETHKGMKHTEASKIKIAAASTGNKNWLGKKHSEETKAKMKGNTNSLGRVASLETRSKMSNSRKGKNSLDPSTLPEREKYDYRVWQETNKNFTKYFYEINPNRLPLGRAGTPGAHHRDHIYPRNLGYKNGVPPEIVGHAANLRVITAIDNVRRARLSSEITLEELYERVECWDLYFETMGSF